MTRFFEWPYWLPTLNGAYGWLRAGRQVLEDAAAAFGLYWHHTPPAVIPKQRTATSDETRETSTL